MHQQLRTDRGSRWREVTGPSSPASPEGNGGGRAPRGRPLTRGPRPPTLALVGAGGRPGPPRTRGGGIGPTGPWPPSTEPPTGQHQPPGMGTRGPQVLPQEPADMVTLPKPKSHPPCHVSVPNAGPGSGTAPHFRQTHESHSPSELSSEVQKGTFCQSQPRAEFLPPGIRQTEGKKRGKCISS